MGPWTFLGRTYSRAKWRIEPAGLGSIAADAVTADLRTTENTLSFWRTTGDETGAAEVALALASVAPKISRASVLLIPEQAMIEAACTFRRRSETREWPTWVRDTWMS